MSTSSSLVLVISSSSRIWNRISLPFKARFGLFIDRTMSLIIRECLIMFSCAMNYEIRSSGLMIMYDSRTACWIWIVDSRDHETKPTKYSSSIMKCGIQEVLLIAVHQDITDLRCNKKVLGITDRDCNNLIKHCKITIWRKQSSGSGLHSLKGNTQCLISICSFNFHLPSLFGFFLSSPMEANLRFS